MPRPEHSRLGARILLPTAIGIWIAIAIRVRFEGLVFGTGPYAYFPFLFWIGVGAALVTFTVDRAMGTRWIAVAVLSLFVIGTLSTAFEFGILHDSSANAESFVLDSSEAGTQFYVNSFPALAVWNSLLASAGHSPFEIARAFPLLMVPFYLGACALISLSWRHSGILPLKASPWLALFVVLFGAAFYVRLNDAPQTIGFAVYLSAIGLVALRDSPLGRISLVAALLYLVLAHPLSPLLAVPGVLISTMVTRSPRDALSRLNVVVLAVAMSAAWIAYQAGWSMTAAIDLARALIGGERALPLGDLTTLGLPGNEAYVNHVITNRIYLIALVVVLTLGWATQLRSRLGLLVTAWLVMLGPVIIAVLGASTFGDRGLLFAVVPAALSFARAAWYWDRRGGGLASAFRRLASRGTTVALGIVGLTSAFGPIAAVDHPTASEVAAYDYAFQLDGRVYIDGFRLANDDPARSLQGDRGVIRESAATADVVVISAQMESAARMRDGIVGPDSVVGRFESSLRRTHRRVFDNGWSRVYAIDPPTP